MVADWNLGEGFPNLPIASPLRAAVFGVGVQEKLIDAAVLPTQFVDRVSLNVAQSPIFYILRSTFPRVPFIRVYVGRCPRELFSYPPEEEGRKGKKDRDDQRWGSERQIDNYMYLYRSTSIDRYVLRHPEPWYRGTTTCTYTCIATMCPNMPSLDIGERIGTVGSGHYTITISCSTCPTRRSAREFIHTCT